MRWLLLRFIIPLLIALPIGYVLLYPQILRCQLVNRSADFVAVETPGGQVYINRVTLKPQGRRFLTNLSQARSRIRQFWGQPRGRALLIYCPVQSQYEEYCASGEGAGCSLGTPWGDSFLVLGPEGNNTDVIAHELCHDELYARLGWFRVKHDIPQWFNEGLAMMLDYRFSSPVANVPGETAARRYENYRAEWLYRTHDPARPSRQLPSISLTNLETTRDFFSGDYSRVMLAYTAAGLEVSRWLARAGQAAVQPLTSAVAGGNDFTTVYKQLESTPPPAADRQRR